jgi:hypothetical protein
MLIANKHVKYHAVKAFLNQNNGSHEEKWKIKYFGAGWSQSLLNQVNGFEFRGLKNMTEKLKSR